MPTKKKPVKKPKKKAWTPARVRKLYAMKANTPTRGPHAGEPHEWDDLEDTETPPMCLGCSATGDQVEELEREGPVRGARQPGEVPGGDRGTPSRYDAEDIPLWGPDEDDPWGRG